MGETPRKHTKARVIAKMPNCFAACPEALPKRVLSVHTEGLFLILLDSESMQAAADQSRIRCSRLGRAQNAEDYDGAVYLKPGI